MWFNAGSKVEPEQLLGLALGSPESLKGNLSHGRGFIPDILVYFRV